MSIMRDCTDIFLQFSVSFIDIVSSSVFDLFTPILYSSSCIRSWNSCLSFSALYVVTCIRSSAYWHARLRYIFISVFYICGGGL